VKNQSKKRILLSVVTDQSQETVIANLKQMSGIIEVEIYRPKPVLVHCSDGKKYPVYGNDIVYIEIDNCYCTIHFVDNVKMLVIESLKTLVEDFAEDGLVRCSKRFAVNLLHLCCMSGNELWLKSGQKIPIGRTYSDALKNCFRHRNTQSRKYR
jgi:DNA-binding LytR/AlgR family response regulator